MLAAVMAVLALGVAAAAARPTRATRAASEAAAAPKTGPGLRRQDDQARRAHAADRPGRGHRRAADRGQRGLLRLRQRGARRHRRQVQGRARAGGHAVHADRTVQQYNQHQGRRGRCSPRSSAPRRRSRCCRSSSATRCSPRRRRSTRSGCASRTCCRSARRTRSRRSTRSTTTSTRATARARTSARSSRTTPTARPACQGVEFAAEELGFEIADTQRFKAGDKDVTGQVQRLQRLQVRRGVPRRDADRRRHDLGHRRQARLRAALDRPVADRGSTSWAPRRWREYLEQDDAGSPPRAPSGATTSVAGHEGHGRARREVRARPGAGLLLRVRLQPGARGDRGAGEGGRARRPLQGGDPEGLRGARDGLASTA